MYVIFIGGSGVLLLVFFILFLLQYIGIIIPFLYTVSLVIFYLFLVSACLFIILLICGLASIIKNTFFKCLILIGGITATLCGAVYLDLRLVHTQQYMEAKQKATIPIELINLGDDIQKFYYKKQNSDKYERIEYMSSKYSWDGFVAGSQCNTVLFKIPKDCDEIAISVFSEKNNSYGYYYKKFSINNIDTTVSPVMLCFDGEELFQYTNENIKGRTSVKVVKRHTLTDVIYETIWIPVIEK